MARFEFRKQMIKEEIDIGKLYVPEPVHFSFDTPGWYLLGGLLFLFVVLLLFRWLKHYRENTYRSEALKNLAIIEDRVNKQQDVLCLNDVLVLLKVVAIKAYGRQEVAQLYGNDWLIFLETKGENIPFTQYKHSILNSLYEAVIVDIKELKTILELSKKWIKTHA